MKLTHTRKFSILISAIAVILLIAAVILNATVLEPLATSRRESEELAARFEAYRAEKRAIFAEENATRTEYDVAFIGDSITDLYDVKSFYPKLTVTNRGICGDTTFDLEGRLELSLFAIKPRVIVMLIGANNPDSMLDNYERIMLTIMERLPESELVLCSITPFKGILKDRNEVIISRNGEIKRLAEKHGLIYVDYFTEMYDEERGQIYEHLTDDDVHPNLAGYEVMTDILSPILYNLLDAEQG